MKKKEYTYAVSRIHVKEMSLLHESDIEALLGAADVTAAMQLLSEKGWEAEGGVDEMLRLEEAKAWELLNELIGRDEAFDLLRAEIDYHNAKVMIKERYLQKEYPAYYMSGGRLTSEALAELIEQKRFGELPEDMKQPTQEAYYALFHTGDGQICDTLLDTGLAAAQVSLAKDGEEILRRYAVLMADLADISCALRGSRAGKQALYFEQALTGLGTLSKNSLAEAALAGEEAVLNYLNYTDYSEAVTAYNKGEAAVSAWQDRVKMELLRGAQYAIDGIAPLFAYLLARRNEITTVRILLSGKKHGLSAADLRERMRPMYV
ncbi:MAG: V-type ATPase subunit [Eubacteriales bacterium]|nr:V-type ATPase subunit [Eubacteriales bacterium]